MLRFIKFTIILTALVCSFVMRAMEVNDVPNVHVADRTQYVSDPAGMLSRQTVGELNSLIGSLWRDRSVELVVALVPEVSESTTPDEFATKLFEAWKIGKEDKDNGVLLLVSQADRKAVIRTGYGVEGALPDVLAGRILRSRMNPYMKQAMPDSAVMSTVRAIDAILRNLDVADEIVSSQPNDAPMQVDDEGNLFIHYVMLCVLVGVGMLVFVVIRIRATRRMPEAERWKELGRVVMPLAVATCLTLGAGAPALLAMMWFRHRLRRHKRLCTHCGTRMRLIDEVHDNDYLSHSQDLEEKLGSVDYDVWHCPTCAQTDIIPYPAMNSDYTVCPNCGARTLRLADRRVLRQPTTRANGEGVDISLCRNCGHHTQRRFTIPRTPDSSGAGAAAAGAILGSMLGGRGGGGGGFSGGSFGGGSTGGGGASSSW